MRRKTRRTLALVIALCGLAAIVIAILIASLDGKETSPDDPLSPPMNPPSLPVVDTPPPSPPVETPKDFPPAADAASARTEELLDHGMSLLGQKKFIEARAVLSEALFSGELDTEQETDLVNRLTELSELTIFSSHVFEHDPYTFVYPF